MNICVIGLGYVGTVSSICLARDGHQVLGIDTDHSKLALIREGKSPVVEDGVQELTRSVVAAGRLTVADQVDARVAASDVVFVCVGTPSADNGSQDLTAVHRVTEQVGEALRDASGYPVIVYRSTLEPGTTDGVIRPALEAASGGSVGTDFGLCFQPEFLREGSSIKDFDNPPMTVIGGDSARSVESLRELFGHLDAEIVATQTRSAELLKLTCNAFHALKVSFANEVGRLGRSLGVDSREVMEVFCKDKSLNISPTYFRPGFAFGGSCLPKDLRALTHLARRQDVDLPVLQGILPSNRTQIEQAAKLVMRSGVRRIGMLGLSFKAGTDDLRESPLVSLAEFLIGKGYDLRIYDPAVRYAQLIGSNRRFIEATIPHIGSLITNDLEEVCRHAEVLVAGHRSPDIESSAAAHVQSRKPLIDLVGLPISHDRAADKETYAGICW